MSEQESAPEVDPNSGGDAEESARKEERRAEEDDLRASLNALSTMATGQLALDDLLRKVAVFAVRAIPGADGAGLTLLEEGRSDTIVTTAPFVQEVDDIQYSIGQGPCITAAADRVTVVSGSLGGDARWPRFGARVARLGVHSAVSLPLLTAQGVVGALNVYAHDKHVFDDRAAELGEVFAVPAAIAVENARVLAESRRLAARLQVALDTRAVIDHAVGIVMSRSGLTEEQALQRLRVLSQSDHKKLAVVARGIVEEAVRRARAHHTAGD
jgi:transcriptional regulator with GAF, ATPase, and Fis domain